jgi:superfamily II DNA or RNA helicase
MKMTPIQEFFAQLTDRSLRRMLGARAFLRGLDAARKGQIAEISFGDDSVTANVKGAEGAFEPVLRLEEGAIASSCGCAFGQGQTHCKHAAALLVALRTASRQERAKNREADEPKPRRVVVSSKGGELASQDASEDDEGDETDTDDGFDDGPEVGFTTGSAAFSSDGSSAVNASGMGRRARRRLARQARMGQLAPRAPGRDAAPSGLASWLNEAVISPPAMLEYRIQARATSLSIALFDPATRSSVSPQSLLAYQAQTPTVDRDAIRLLARFESEQGRRPYVELRGEDAADFIQLVWGRRVVLEPRMVELRFAEEPLRPGFSLETDGETLTIRPQFQRQGDARKFALHTGTWLDGSPSYHLDPQDGVVRPIDKRVSPHALRRMFRVPVIREPNERMPELIASGLPRVAAEIGAELPPLDQVADMIDVTPVIRMRAGGTLTEAQVSLRVAYNEVEIDVRADGMTAPVIVLPSQNKQERRVRCIRCDIAAQQAAASKLREIGLRPDESGSMFVLQGEAAIRFWTEGIGQLPDTWDLFVPDDLVDVQVRSQSLAATARVSSGVDWLALKLSFDSEGVAVTQEELARCLSEGRKYARLADGSYAAIDLERVKEILRRQAEILATGGGQGGKLPLSQAGRIQDLLGQVGKSTVTDGTKTLFKKLRDIDEIKGVKKPRTLKASLRPYQEQGFQWLMFLNEIGAGGVLADDMGLGKTVQTIAMMLAVKALQEKADKKFAALIIAPTSVVRNWEREIAKFAPTLSTIVWYGGDRKKNQERLHEHDVILTSYGHLRNDEELFSTLPLTYAILDEAQNIKNPVSATAKAAKRIRAERRLALSGTPIENRLSEIWSIFDFVSPGLLGPLDKFEERYARPIDAGDEKVAKRLRGAIHPFILRRTKSEVLKDLPEKIESDQLCELTGEQTSLYSAVLKEVRTQIMGEVEKQGMAKSQIKILAALTKLRQAACDPRLLGLPREFKDDDSGKLVALRELVQTSVEGGHRVLVFSQFVSMLTLIRAALTEDKIAYEYLDGSTVNRQAKVENFQRPDGPPVFLISLKAGGSGLNLTAADTVIHFDPWWNPAVEDQATDRAHRIGQTKVVTTYRLIARGTIEEKILELGAKKRELVGAVLSEDTGGAKKLTKADLEQLFEG